MIRLSGPEYLAHLTAILNLTQRSLDRSGQLILQIDEAMAASEVLIAGQPNLEALILETMALCRFRS
jgi:hypothetical protein